jgi:hypothetical protein
MPSTCKKPWATGLAFLQLSDLMLKTHLQPMVLWPFDKSVSLRRCADGVLQASLGKQSFISSVLPLASASGL